MPAIMATVPNAMCYEHPMRSPKILWAYRLISFCVCALIVVPLYAWMTATCGWALAAIVLVIASRMIAEIRGDVEEIWFPRPPPEP